MKKQERNYDDLKTVMESNTEATVRDVRSGGNFKFPAYLREADYYTDIEVLDLSERSKNALKRSNIHTIADLINNVKGSADLRKIRNCGQKSVQEILTKLFLYELMSVPESRREQYLEDVIAHSMESKQSTRM